MYSFIIHSEVISYKTLSWHSGAQDATVNATVVCSINPSSGLGFTTQQATPPEFGEKWEIEVS